MLWESETVFHWAFFSFLIFRQNNSSKYKCISFNGCSLSYMSHNVYIETLIADTPLSRKVPLIRTANFGTKASISVKINLLLLVHTSIKDRIFQFLQCPDYRGLLITK